MVLGVGPTTLIGWIPALRTGESSNTAYPLYVPMFDGVPMDIIHMPVEIFGPHLTRPGVRDRYEKLP